MGRHSKAYKEQLRREEEMRKLYEDESDFETSTLQSMHRIQKEKVKTSNQLGVSKVKVQPKKVVVEDEEPDDNDTVKLTHAQRKAESKKKASRLTLINLIDKLAVAISEVGDPEDIKCHLTEDGTIDLETISELQKNCMVLKNSLKHLGSIGDTPDVTVPSTSSHYGDYVVYRPPNQDLLYLLSVAEVFKPNHQAYGNRKTLGFVRQKDTQFPLSCALSGWTNVLDYHPRMLDTEFWLDEVKNFAATQLDYVFKAGCWDRANGRDDGDGYASHVELTLMLFYACHLVAKKLGIKTSIRQASRSIWKLKLLKEKFEAEIVISKAPCAYCKQFQRLFQKFSGVKFTYVIMDNVAEVFPEKDARGYELYPKFAEDDNHEEMLEALSIMIEYGGVTPRKTGSRLAIEIPSEPESPTPRVALRPKAKVYKPTPQVQAPDWHHNHSETSSTVNNHQQEEARQSSPMYSEVVTTKTVQKRRIQSFTYEDPNKSIILDDSDSDEYVPDNQTSSLKVYSSQPKTTPKRGPSYTPLTPDSGPFGLEARQRAQQIRNKKKKRASESGPSSTASKKQRWNHPDYRLAE